MAFDFDLAVSAPFRMQPGLRRLPVGAQQLTPLRPGDCVLQQKLAVLSEHAAQALLASPGFDAQPAVAALCAHAASEHPTAFAWDGAQGQALHLGWAVYGDELLPLPGAQTQIGACLDALPAHSRLAGLLALAFAEDFAIVDVDSGSIPWLVVCLPSHWAPETKVGRSFAEVHAAVADNAMLIAAGAQLMRLVAADGRWERFVWSITPHPKLDAHPVRCPRQAWPADATPDQLAAVAYWRTECQTFIPLPELRQAVFTIRVEVQALARAVGNREQASRLHAALASMSPAVLAYRGLTDAQGRLLEWLAVQAAR